MSETITRYKIFVASPDDLKEEREAVDTVINELNLTFGKQNNLVIEVLKWETHSAPGIGKNHVQEIINEDIGDDYDIFLGLLWLKFGTKTDSANSGTETEFNIAYNKFTNNPSSVQILFYFKNQPPINLDDINIEELKKINEFKNKIGQENVLYWKYKTSEDFEKYLRIHIPKRIMDLIKTRENYRLYKETKESGEIDKTEVIEELGLFDFQEIIETNIIVATQALEKITSATNWMGDKFKIRTESMLKLQSQPANIKKAGLRSIFKSTANDMNEYSSKIEKEIPIFFDNYKIGIDALSSIIKISDDFINPTNIQDLVNTKESTIVLNEGIKYALTKVNEFYGQFVKFPRMEKELNQAKNKVAQILKDFIDKLNSSCLIGDELVGEISQKILRLELFFDNNKINL